MQDPYGRPTLMPALYYQEPFAALDFLEKAFGFERSMVITDDAGQLAHSEMRLGDGLICVGSPWTDYIAAPGALGGKVCITTHVHLNEDIDAHCARARAAGAEILAEPSDQFYGDRTYRARDPEGHVWTFAQSLRVVSREEAEAATGLKIDGWP